MRRTAIHRERQEVTSYLSRNHVRTCFCVNLSSSVIPFDEQNENYNLCLKKTPTTSSLDVAIMRLRHVMVGNKAAKELWGIRKQGKQVEQNLGLTFPPSWATEWASSMQISRIKFFDASSNRHLYQKLPSFRDCGRAYRKMETQSASRGWIDSNWLRSA